MARLIPCDPAPSAIVDLINASFTTGERLTDAQSVTSIKDMTCLGGNIEFANGVRVSSADVWVVQHGAVFALSSDARRRTLLPVGRDIASAGDEYGAAVQECVGEAARAIG